MKLSNKLGCDIMKIALAYGSRGTSASPSQYDSVKKVISLTKIRGAGNLAHEYGRAIDDFLGDILDKSGPLSECVGRVKCRYSIRKGNKEDLYYCMANVIYACRYIVLDDRGIEEVTKDDIINKKREFDKLEKSLVGKYSIMHTNMNNYDKAIFTEYKNLKDRIDDENEIKGIIEGVSRDLDNTSSILARYSSVILKDISCMSSKNCNVLSYEDVYEFQKLLRDRINGIITCINTMYKKLIFNDNSKELTKFYKFHSVISSSMINSRMFAYAFERYVYEKLKKNGVQSDYLVAFVTNNYYKSMNVYPEGVEYEKIESAIDELFDTLIKLYPNIEMRESVKNKYNGNYSLDTYQTGKDIANDIYKESVADSYREHENKSIVRDVSEGNEDNCRLYVRNRISETYKNIMNVTKKMTDAKKCQLLVSVYNNIGIERIDLGEIYRKRGNSQAYDIVNGKLVIDYTADNAKKAEAIIEACNLLYISSNNRELTKDDIMHLWDISMVMVCKVMNIDVRTYMFDKYFDVLYKNSYNDFKYLYNAAKTACQPIIDGIYRGILEIKLNNSRG